MPVIFCLSCKLDIIHVLFAKTKSKGKISLNFFLELCHYKSHSHGLTLSKLPAMCICNEQNYSFKNRTKLNTDSVY